MEKYCFVLDADGKPLSPTKEVKGWYMVRKGKAKLVSKYPYYCKWRNQTNEYCCVYSAGRK